MIIEIEAHLMFWVIDYHSDCESHSMGGFTKICTLNCRSISVIPVAVPGTASEVNEVIFGENV